MSKRPEMTGITNKPTEYKQYEDVEIQALLHKLKIRLPNMTLLKIIKHVQATRTTIKEIIRDEGKFNMLM